jgi:hypothetical protein
MLPTHCPTCHRPCSPVYCAASTPEAPLLLAYTVPRAAEMLGAIERVFRTRLEAWHGGWRIVPPAASGAALTAPCRWCGERQRDGRGALALHERKCRQNPARRAA